MTDQQILYEIRDRVTRLETKLDNIQDLKSKAYEAHRMGTESKIGSGRYGESFGRCLLPFLLHF